MFGRLPRAPVLALQHSCCVPMRNKLPLVKHWIWKHSEARDSAAQGLCQHFTTLFEAARLCCHGRKCLVMLVSFVLSVVGTQGVVLVWLLKLACHACR